MVTPGSATIVGGDFNEPEVVLPDNRVASFLGDWDATAEGTWQGFPRARWQDAVAAMLSPREDLQHAWLSRNPGSFAATHKNRGTDRFFDHLLVSNHFVVTGAGFHHQWRTSGLSDHSAAWAELKQRGETPAKELPLNLEER